MRTAGAVVPVVFGARSDPQPPRPKTTLDPPVLRQAPDDGDFVRPGSAVTLGILPVKSQLGLILSSQEDERPKLPSLTPFLYVGVLTASGLNILTELDIRPQVGVAAALIAMYAAAVGFALIATCVPLLRPRSKLRLPPGLLCGVHLALVLLEAKWQEEAIPAVWKAACLQMTVLQCSAMTFLPASRGWAPAPVASALVLGGVMASTFQLSARDVLHCLLLPTLAMCFVAAHVWVQKAGPNTSFWQKVREALRGFVLGEAAVDAERELAEVLRNVVRWSATNTREAMLEELATTLSRLKAAELPTWLKLVLHQFFMNLSQQVNGLQLQADPLDGLEGLRVEEASQEVQNFVMQLLPRAPRVGSNLSNLSNSESFNAGGFSFTRIATPMPKVAAALPFEELVEGLVEPLLYAEEVATMSQEEAFPAVKFMALHLGTWGFDLLAMGALCGQRPLHLVAEEMLKPIIMQLGLQKSLVRGFLTSLEGHYRASNAYHNSIHATDVLNSMGYFLGLKSTCLHKMQAQDRLAAFVAAACHDVGHDGKSNRFHTARQTAIAQLYNDQSCSENMHCAITFALLASDGCNFMQALLSSEVTAFRNMVVPMILDTDLGKHFQCVAAFKKDFVESRSAPLETPQQRQQLLSFVLKASDVGASAKPFALHAQWTTRINNEFFGQGDEEKQLGLPPSPFCDRSGRNVADSQKGFYSFIVMPVLQGLNDYLQSRRVLEDVLAEATLNQEFWQGYPSDDFNYQDPVASVPALVQRYKEIRGK